VWENLAVNRYAYVKLPDQPQDVLFLRPDQEKVLEKHTCPETGVELELEEKIPLLEYLANHYKEFGAQLEIVTDKSQEGSQFCSGFGGIGGMLRYRVDFDALAFDPGEEDDLDDVDLDDYM